MHYVPHLYMEGSMSFATFRGICWPLFLDHDPAVKSREFAAQ
jgi:hypothetical protein